MNFGPEWVQRRADARGDDATRETSLKQQAAHCAPHNFTRTTCACARCVRCCKEQPGPLAPGDFERIVEHFREHEQLTHEQAERKVRKQLCAAPGALVHEFLTLNTVRVGSITPRSRKGRCVFLTENNRCSIHEVAPFGCAYFDPHMPDEVADPRSVWLAEQQATEQYQQLRDTLQLADNYREELAKRR